MKDTTSPPEAIEWQEPPPTPHGRNGNSKWQRFVAALKDRPGEWAIAPIAGRGAGGGVLSNLKAAGCETTTRKQPDGSWVLYARWPEDES